MIRSIKNCAVTAVIKFINTVCPAPASHVNMNSLAWRAAVIAAIAVVFCGFVDATLGGDGTNAPTVWHFIAVAFQGVACSVVASAAYSIFVEYGHIRARHKLRDDFCGLFGLPGMTASPNCFIVVPEISALNVNAPQPAGNALSGQLLLPLPIQWGPDVACANELQSMIATVLGTAPNWVTPDVAIERAKTSKEPAIVFSVGLWSNPFSRFVCQGGVDPLQNLLRLPMSPDDGTQVVLPGWPGCRLLSAKP